MSKIVFLLLCLFIGVYGASVEASTRHHVRGEKHEKADSAIRDVSPAMTPCKMSISPKEDREIIILKLQQRMDCLEVKVNELEREMTMLRAR